MSSKKGLPTNAYRPLNKDESYTPYIPSEQSLPEFTFKSVFFGIQILKEILITTMFTEMDLRLQNLQVMFILILDYLQALGIPMKFLQ